MSLNFLAGHIYGGGPAHLLTNPAPRSCIAISSMNVTIMSAAFGSLLYATYSPSTTGGEVSQYLIAVAVMNCYSALYFARLATYWTRSDNEWSRALLQIGVQSALQYGLIVWGAWLCYRMFFSSAFTGTRMYFYFRFGKWMYNSILGISTLNSLVIVYTTYVALVRILVSLVVQRSKQKYSI